MKKTKNCFWCGKNKFEHIAQRSDGINVIMCVACELMQVAESPENLAEHFYNEEYYTPGQQIESVGYDDYYTLVNPLFLLWQASLIKHVTDSQKKYQLLDIGCATGNLMEIIEAYCQNISTKGIDISKYAVEHCKKKGLKVERAFIEHYQGPKSDIVTSLETLEHLDNLKEFVRGVKDNLKASGSFFFYVPSVSRKELEDKVNLDVRLKTNLEHLIYFTPEFFQKEFGAFFGAKIKVQEIVSEYGRLITGVVSFDSEVIDRFSSVFSTLSSANLKTPEIDKIEDEQLKDLIILSAKFYGEGRTKRLLDSYLQRTDVLNTDKNYTLGVVAYHQGSLATSSSELTKYYAENPKDITALKIILSNQTTYVNILLEEVASLKNGGKGIVRIKERIMALRSRGNR